MKIKILKEEAEKKIKRFFQSENFSADEVRKIKKTAMKFNIKLGKYRRKFCKSCLNKLEGKTRISKNHKTVICSGCGYKNKFRLLK